MRNSEKSSPTRVLLQLGIISLTFLAPAVAPVTAQQVTGKLGSADATTTIDGKQIPPPPPKFGGVIKESAKDSTPWWPPRIVPPKGAPNVLLIMTDDQGYGVSGTFGGVIPTPALDRIAKAGLRYTQFHSTALCSPTRAALITGRNHHSVGFGVIGELSTGYPGYDSVIGPESATIGEILKENGYATSWFGKNHNTPGFQYSAGIAGVTELSPVGRKATTARCRHCGTSLKWHCPVCKRKAWVDERRCECGFRQALREPVVQALRGGPECLSQLRPGRGTRTPRARPGVRT